MAWAVRASTNTLATPDNLARWGKQVGTTCQLEGCGAKSTLGHILSKCDVTLERRRYRHDSCLGYIVDTLKVNKPDHITFYADLEGCRVNGGTIPPELVLTDQVPDLVILDRSSTPNKVYLVELTCCWDSEAMVSKANNRKKICYTYLASDIEDKGYECMNLPLELGVRGVITAKNREVLTQVARLSKMTHTKSFIKKLGKLALLGSYKIYLARNSPDWSPGGYLTV